MIKIIFSARYHGFVFQQRDYIFQVKKVIGVCCCFDSTDVEDILDLNIHLRDICYQSYGRDIQQGYPVCKRKMQH